MARPLPIPMQKLHFLPASFTFFIVFTGVFSVFSAVTFLCGAHGGEKETVRLGGKSNPTVKAVKNRFSSKALLMAKLISWGKVGDGGAEAEEFDEDGGAVWKKTIIKGEKCRPLEFSGRILYDSNGNLLPE